MCLRITFTVYNMQYAYVSLSIHKKMNIFLSNSCQYIFELRTVHSAQCRYRHDGVDGDSDDDDILHMPMKYCRFGFFSAIFSSISFLFSPSLHTPSSIYEIELVLISISIDMMKNLFCFFFYYDYPSMSLYILIQHHPLS